MATVWKSYLFGEFLFGDDDLQPRKMDGEHRMLPRGLCWCPIGLSNTGQWERRRMEQHAESVHPSPLFPFTSLAFIERVLQGSKACATKLPAPNPNLTLPGW